MHKVCVDGCQSVFTCTNLWCSFTCRNGFCRVFLQMSVFLTAEVMSTHLFFHYCCNVALKDTVSGKSELEQNQFFLLSQKISRLAIISPSLLWCHFLLHLLQVIQIWIWHFTYQYFIYHTLSSSNIKTYIKSKMDLIRTSMKEKGQVIILITSTHNFSAVF